MSLARLPMENCRRCSCERKSVLVLVVLCLYISLFVICWKLHFSESRLISTSCLPRPELKKRDGGQSGYILACSVPEQLESGMYDLHQLGDIAHSWDMKLGEPTIHGSRFLFALSQKYQWTLRNIFNISDLNLNFRRYFNMSYDLVIGSQEILADSCLGRDAVFVYWSDYKGSDENCSKIASSTIRRCFEDSPLKEKNRNIMRNVICLKRSDSMNFRTLVHELPILKRVVQENKKRGTKFLLIFSNWNGIRTKPNGFFFLDPHFALQSYGYAHAILHSSEVMNAVMEFKEALNLAQTVVGIHIRLEKLLSRHNLTDIGKCLYKLVFSVKRLKQKHSNISFIAFTDYKPLGSQTCNAHCVNASKELAIDKHLESVGVLVNPVLKWSKESSLKHVSGFVANVEQELLSQADFMILTGSGGFQVGITKRYVRYHNVSEKSAETNFIRICQ